MSEVRLGTIRRSRFIDRRIFEEENERNRAPSWIARPGFESLMDKFVRHKVLLDFSTTGLDVSKDDDYGDIEDIVVSIHSWCDEHCSGLWTLTKSYRRIRDFNVATMSSTETGNGEGKIYVHFENEEDIEPFLKDCAVILKLGH